MLVASGSYAASAVVCGVIQEKVVRVMHVWCVLATQLAMSRGLANMYMQFVYPHLFELILLYFVRLDG